MLPSSSTKCSRLQTSSFYNYMSFCEPRSLFWTWLRHPIGTSKQFFSVTTPVGYFVLMCYLAHVHCKSLAEARIKAWSTKVGKHWQVLQSKSHCLQTTSLSKKVAHDIHLSKLPYGEMLLDHTRSGLMQLSMVDPKMKTLGVLHLNLPHSIYSKLQMKCWSSTCCY